MNADCVIHISGHGTTAIINASRGAEISSLTMHGIELVHRANDYSDAPQNDWYGHGQLLWPAVGRHKSGKCTHAGKELDMPLHGFAKDRAFAVVSQKAESVTLSYTVSASDAHMYPFTGTCLIVTYTVCEDGSLACDHSVQNTGTDNVPFAIGNHITLAFPFNVPGAPEGLSGWHAGVLRGSITHQLGLGPGSLLDGTALVRGEFASEQGCPLSAPGITDGVFALDRSNTLAAAAGPCTLTLSLPGYLDVTVSHAWTAPPIQSQSSKQACDWAEVQANRLFVLWGMPPDSITGQRGFLCPEPWVSGPDSLNTRVGLPVLAPGQQATWQWTVRADRARVQ